MIVRCNGCGREGRTRALGAKREVLLLVDPPGSGGTLSGVDLTSLPHLGPTGRWFCARCRVGTTEQQTLG